MSEPTPLSEWREKIDGFSRNIHDVKDTLSEAEQSRQKAHEAFQAAEELRAKAKGYKAAGELQTKYHGRLINLCWVGTALLLLGSGIASWGRFKQKNKLTLLGAVSASCGLIICVRSAVIIECCSKDYVELAVNEFKNSTALYAQSKEEATQTIQASVDTRTQQEALDNELNHAKEQFEREYPDD